ARPSPPLYVEAPQRGAARGRLRRRAAKDAALERGWRASNEPSMQPPPAVPVRREPLSMQDGRSLLHQTISRFPRRTLTAVRALSDEVRSTIPQTTPTRARTPPRMNA